jgi:hypothetical protein
MRTVHWSIDVIFCRVGVFFKSVQHGTLKWDFRLDFWNWLEAKHSYF